MKVIVIYGTECDEKTAWIPWLRNTLASAGVECIIPKLPTPGNQTCCNWSKILQKVTIKSDDVVVAWSTGAIFSVRYLFENNLKVKRLILISGFNNYIGNVPVVDNINKDFFIKDESIANSVAKEIICVKSDNDPFITQEALLSFAKNLSAKIVDIKNGGHFNLNAGYDKFEELIPLILN